VNTFRLPRPDAVIRLLLFLFAQSAVVPPDASFPRQIRIERLRDGSPERVEHARILLRPSGVFKLAIQALWAPARELGDLMDAERSQIPFDGWTHGPEVAKPAPFLRAPGGTALNASVS
jgi:hypothetical protein